MIVSVEQAHALFLDPSKNCLNLSQYTAYSKLMRAGYILFKHDPNLDREIFEREVKRYEVDLETDLIWNCLMEKLNQPIQSQLIEDNQELFETIKNSMDLSCEIIKSQNSKIEETPLAGSDFWKHSNMSSKSLKKRVSEIKAQTSSKKVKIYQQTGSFLDILKVEKEYQEFRGIFESIDVVKKLEEFSTETSRDLKFDFDVYSPNSTHKKSDPPDYRMVILW